MDCRRIKNGFEAAVKRQVSLEMILFLKMINLILVNLQYLRIECYKGKWFGRDANIHATHYIQTLLKFCKKCPKFTTDGLYVVCMRSFQNSIPLNIRLDRAIKVL